MSDSAILQKTELNGDLGYGRNRLSAARAPDELVFTAATGIARNTDQGSRDFSAVYTSIQQYRHQRKIKFNSTASYGDFSAEVHASFENKYTSDQESTAAIRGSVHVFGKVWLSAVSVATLSPAFIAASEALPSAYSVADANKFFQFFDKFGTDVVTEVTLGGKLYFETLVKKSKITDVEKIKVELEAEYGMFFTADGSVDQSTTRKEYMESRTATVTTEGGQNGIFSDLLFKKAEKYAAKVKTWVDSIKDKPVPIERAFKPVYAFLPEGPRRDAVEEALHAYLGRYLTVHSTWRYSSLTLGGTTQSGVAAGGDTRPGIKVRVFDRKSLTGREEYFTAPAIGRPAAEIEQFWNDFEARVKAMGLSNAIVLLATQYWPRESRYAPPDRIVDFLAKKCGGRDATLRRWRSDSLACVPCPYAGISYGMIGYGEATSQEVGGDAYVIGFGDSELTLNPELEIIADLSSRGDGTVKFTCNDIFNGAAIKFKKIRSDHWDKWYIAADADDTTRVKMADESEGDAAKLLWYAQPAGEKYGMHPVYLVNAKTCAVLQWDSGGGAVEKEAVLRPYAPNLDINLWDLRLPYIMTLSYNPNWDLRCFENRRVKVATFDGRDTELKWSISDVSKVL